MDTINGVLKNINDSVSSNLLLMLLRHPPNSKPVAVSFINPEDPLQGVSSPMLPDFWKIFKIVSLTFYDLYRFDLFKFRK